MNFSRFALTSANRSRAPLVRRGSGLCAKNASIFAISESHIASVSTWFGDMILVSCTLLIASPASLPLKVEPIHCCRGTRRSVPAAQCSRLSRLLANSDRAATRFRVGYTEYSQARRVYLQLQDYYTAREPAPTSPQVTTGIAIPRRAQSNRCAAPASPRFPAKFCIREFAVQKICAAPL